jgi:hypothetical protein
MLKVFWWDTDDTIIQLLSAEISFLRQNTTVELNFKITIRNGSGSTFPTSLRQQKWKILEGQRRDLPFL